MKIKKRNELKLFYKVINVETLFWVLLVLFFLSSCVSIPLPTNEKDCGPGSDKKTYCIDKIFK